jgi:NADH:ubiquinone oxidoreductase subunit F (NADH-binding)
VKYVVCNADEGDPGAFMDRSVLEGDPHTVLEGMMIAAYAIGASHGYVYCRAEYPLAVKRLKRAIALLTEKGYLGQNIFGSSVYFDVKLRGWRALCGEETALIASIEGKRGTPRPRPFPAVRSCGKPPASITSVRQRSLDYLNGAADTRLGTGKQGDQGLRGCRAGKRRPGGSYQGSPSARS